MNDDLIVFNDGTSEFHNEAIYEKRDSVWWYIYDGQAYTSDGTKMEEGHDL
jgi:hypothetical protein